MTAASSWVPCVQHLLSQAPVTAEDTELWLHLLPFVRGLLATHAVQHYALQLKATVLFSAALPVLGSKQAAQPAPSLPLALTSLADAAGMLSTIHMQLKSAELTQVAYCVKAACMH